MLELPEMLTIATQLNEAITGKVVAAVESGNSPHKFAFFRPPAGEISRAMAGAKVHGVNADGKTVFVDARPGDVFVINEMAGRVLFHAAGAPLPAKYQLLITFRDGASVTATVGLWGFFGLRDRATLGAPPFRADGIAPLGKEFTLARFERLFAEYPKPAAAIKAFLINHPSINGFGNGYMQEILLRAGIRPARRVVEATPAERKRLHAAIRDVLREAAAKRGSQDECDIYGKPGGYVKTLGAKVKTCRVCGSRIQKISFLGGATYFCPKCQS